MKAPMPTSNDVSLRRQFRVPENIEASHCRGVGGLPLFIGKFDRDFGDIRAIDIAAEQ